VNLLAEGGEAVAEALGDDLLATAIDEDSAEGLVEALGIVGGLEEEKATRGVVHTSVPGCEALLSRNSPGSIAEHRQGGHAPRGQGTTPPTRKQAPLGVAAPGAPAGGLVSKKARSPRYNKNKAHTEPRLKPGNPGLRGPPCEELGYCFAQLGSPIIVSPARR
jgi:hypothetical protein